MALIRQILVLFICLTAVFHAQAASSTSRKSMKSKIMLSKTIWSPIFATINFKDKQQKLPMTEQQFHRANELFYRAYAEYFDESELLLLKKMFSTHVGKKIGENMMRAMMGLQPFTLTYGSFSKKDKTEWESFARENYQQFKQLQNKMKGFSQFIRRKFVHKKTAPGHANK